MVLGKCFVTPGIGEVASVNKGHFDALIAPVSSGWPASTVSGQVTVSVVDRGARRPWAPGISRRC